MRSSYQLFYDRVYYGFEKWLQISVMNLRERYKLFGRKFDREFHRAYKNSIRPYWAKFGVRPHKLWFKYYYLLTGSLDPRYIPDDIHFNTVVRHFNPDDYIRQLEDKNLHTLIFPGIKRPETVFKRLGASYTNDDFKPISRQEAMARLQEEGDFIVKPTRYTGQGANVRVFHTMSSEETEALLAPYDSKADYIVQKVVRQHPSLAHFNRSSLNTLRVVTLVFHDKPHLLSAILRVGHDGSPVDNVSAGGYQAVVRPDGKLEKLAYTKKDGKTAFVEQTDSGVRFENFQIPSWDKVRDTALYAAEHLPHLKFIGWDFAVDEAGDVVLIEFNPELGQNQENCGPTFGDITDEVLAEVFKKRA